jgi:hypothetical protein
LVLDMAREPYNPFKFLVELHNSKYPKLAQIHLKNDGEPSGLESSPSLELQP